MVEQLKQLLESAGLQQRATLAGAFCMGKCQQGVCVSVDEAFFSLTPETVEAFFAAQVQAKLG